MTIDEKKKKAINSEIMAPPFLLGSFSPTIPEKYLGLLILFLSRQFPLGLSTWFSNKKFYFMLSGRMSRNIGENIFRSYTGTTSENTDFHVLVA